MIKRYGISYIILFFILIFVGCNRPENINKKETLARINIGHEPQSLDPRMARDLCSQNLIRMLFDGLMRVGKNEKAEPALAKHISMSSDAKKYTFSLREAKWSNGDLVTAMDFIYAWKKTLDPTFGSDLASHLYVIKNAKMVQEGKLEADALGAHAIDEKTLEVELEYPTPYFLELIAYPAFFPVNARIDQSNPHWMQSPSSYVCNGPFRLNEWEHQDHVTVKKNVSYWDAPSVHLSTLEMIMVSEDTELKMFEKKELDWAGSPLSTLPVEAIHFFKKDQMLKTKEMLGTYFIRVNTACSPFQHPLMRKAFALAINRKDIVDHVTQGNQIPALGLVPLSLGLQKEPYFKDGDIDEARQLFSDALSSMHLDRRSFPEVKLLYVASERNHLIAQALEQQWYKAFGLRIKLESCERKIYFDRLSKEAYQLAAGSWIADFNDPINFLDVFRYKKASSNNTLWENPQYIELLHRSTMMINPEERLGLLKQSERLLIEEMPILPIFYFTMLYLQHPHLHDVILSPGGIFDFKWASVSSSMIAEGERK